MDALNSFVQNASKAQCHFNKTREINHIVDIIDRIAMNMNIPVQRAIPSTGYAARNSQVNQIGNSQINYNNAALSDIM
jgi:hypothetical protein